MRTVVWQSTADDDDTDAQRRDHGMDERGHVPRDDAHVPSRRPKLIAYSRCSRPLSNVPLSLKCRDTRRDLDHVKNDSNGARRVRKNSEKITKKSL